MSTVCLHFPTTTKQRHNYSLRGRLQGMGFRPFIHRLAAELNLTGGVLTDASVATIEVQGIAVDLNRFARADIAAAVERLRTLKRRDWKPLALMVPDLRTARRLGRLSAEAAARLVRQLARYLRLSAGRTGSSASSDASKECSHV